MWNLNSSVSIRHHYKKKAKQNMWLEKQQQQQQNTTDLWLSKSFSWYPATNELMAPFQSIQIEDPHIVKTIIIYAHFFNIKNTCIRSQRLEFVKKQQKNKWFLRNCPGWDLESRNTKAAYVYKTRNFQQKNLKKKEKYKELWASKSLKS